jgi:hypothetical protein
VEQVLTVEIDANIDSAQEGGQELVEVMARVPRWIKTGKRKRCVRGLQALQIVDMMRCSLCK